MAGTEIFQVVMSLTGETTHLPQGTVIDRILVEKGKRQMHVYRQGVLLKTYRIALGFCPMGHKEVEGDGKTPEGFYYVNDKNPRSAYHLNLGISYPNDRDRAHAQSLGQSPGGAIKIHGLKNGSAEEEVPHHRKDWTAGCIAVTNDEMDELYCSVPLNTPIEIQK